MMVYHKIRRDLVLIVNLRTKPCSQVIWPSICLTLKVHSAHRCHYSNSYERKMQFKRIQCVPIAHERRLRRFVAGDVAKYEILHSISRKQVEQKKISSIPDERCEDDRRKGTLAAPLVTSYCRIEFIDDNESRQKTTNSAQAMCGGRELKFSTRVNCVDGNV